MNHFYRSAALVGLSYLEARILDDREMEYHISNLTPPEELRISIIQAVLYIAKTLNEDTDLNIESSLENIQKTRALLIKQIINV